jgi:peptidoglycan/xylan/chitin deacetylase (PgdA/CDA1 family)
MKRQISRATLRVLRGMGVFRLVRDSRWRRQRLLILCQHGVSQEDEHLWRPALYIAPERLEQRLGILKRGEYNVLPLNHALERLHAGDLSPRSVVLTFDDGTYDFYAQAYPRLQRFGFPVTVYQTTYYSDHQMPVFNLICSFMLWKRRGTVLDTGTELGLKPPMDLRTDTSRRDIVRSLLEISERENLSGPQKNEVAGRLANVLGLNYGSLQSRRILHLMSAEEIAELARKGVDFQLHTHRHRTPMDEGLFRKEIQDNRQRLREITGIAPMHFCYPSGTYDARFFPWLTEERIVSATTCDPGLATAQTNLLHLPRFVDTTGRTEVEFESWLTGIGEFLAGVRTIAGD